MHERGREGTNKRENKEEDNNHAAESTDMNHEPKKRGKKNVFIIQKKSFLFL